jgi:hypothetical protein
MSEAVDDALLRLLQAARQEGIEPDTPMGRWHQAVVALTEAVQDRMARLVNTAKAASDAEVERARLAAEEASAAARRADAALKALTVQAEQTIAIAVEKMTPALAEAVERGVVIRERRHNSRELALRASLGAALVLVCLGGGYALRAVADRPATTLYDRCLRTAAKATDGKLYCPVEGLSDAAEANQGRR